MSDGFKPAAEIMQDLQAVQREADEVGAKREKAMARLGGYINTDGELVRGVEDRYTAALLMAELKIRDGFEGKAPAADFIKRLAEREIDESLYLEYRALSTEVKILAVKASRLSSKIDGLRSQLSGAKHLEGVAA